MNPISQIKFYELGAKLHRVVATKTAVGAAEMFVPLMEAQAALDNLIKGDPITLDIAKADASALLNKLGNLFNRYFIDMNTRQFRFPGREEVIDGHELTLLRALIEKFETALSAELARKAIYAVPRIGLYDSAELTERAENQFSDDVQRALGEHVREDIRAAGRALAFGLPTAACFHLVRAIEAVFTRYFEILSGQSLRGDTLWKGGIAHLSGMKGKDAPEPRVLSLLSDVDARYRTHLGATHSDLGMDEALLFFGMAGSLITLMVEGLRGKEKTARVKKPDETMPKELQQDIMTDEEAAEVAASFAGEASAALRRGKAG